MSRRKIICLTPVKNEAWVLDTFLKSASVWADHILIADQNSTDSSVETAKKFAKVTVVDNSSDKYNELSRQQLLINLAREKFGTYTILFALDADEILVNFYDNEDWKNIHSLEPGTAIFFPWLNVLPGNKTYFPSIVGKMLFGYIDDGKEHTGKEIHSPRVPFYDDSQSILISSVKVLHFQFAVKERQLSKHRWYECLEKIKFPEKNSIDLYRMYHHIDIPIPNEYEIPHSWFKHYQENGIDISAIKDDGLHWWDREVCLLLQQHGEMNFKKQYIWYKDWNAINKSYFPNTNRRIKDPRSIVDKMTHYWLKKSQQNPSTILNRSVNKVLRFIKW